MTQRRVIDFGSPITAEKLGDIVNSLTAPRVMEGLSITPHPDFTDRLSITPGSASVLSTYSGTDKSSTKLIITDQAQVLYVSTPVTAIDYTILYTHLDSEIVGGNEAVLDLVEGLYTSYENSVILGWLVYPGGGVPLQNWMIYQTPKVREDPVLSGLTGSDVRHPPFSGVFGNSVSTDITATNEWWQNQIVTKLVCGVVVGFREAAYVSQHSVETYNGEVLLPKSLFARLEIDTLTATRLDLTLYDSVGTAFSCSDNPISSALLYQDYEWVMKEDIEGATLNADGVFQIGWRFRLDPNDTVRWGRFALTGRDLPYGLGYTSDGP